MNKYLKYLCACVLIVLLTACTLKEKETSLTGEDQVEIVVNPAIDLFGHISRLAEVN